MRLPFSDPRIAAGAMLFGLAVAAWFVVRHFALKLKLGSVELSIPHQVVASGEPWLVELHFRPPRNCRINSISLTLQADESTVSGSGTDRTNHRNTVFQQIIPLRESEILPAGEVVHERLLMTFPETTSLSVEAGANRLRWSALVRIDIPGFPDWTSTTPLQVLHPGLPVCSRPIRNSCRTGINQTPLPNPLNTRPFQHPAEPTLLRRTPTRTQRTSPPCSQNSILTALTAAPGPVSSAAIGQRLAVSVTINRSVTTIGNSEEDPLYCGGLTVEGTLDGSRQTIRIITLASAATELEALPERILAGRRGTHRLGHNLSPHQRPPTARREPLVFQRTGGRPRLSATITRTPTAVKLRSKSPQIPTIFILTHNPSGRLDPENRTGDELGKALKHRIRSLD
ncbi:MAG UNVERIFIED_CONTAM: hypothetical protein LVR18_15955 [Planctomycetaceae bacterium]